MDHKAQGKKNRAAGLRFELKVRKTLEEGGWIVAKWMNNISDFPEENINVSSKERKDRKLVPAKHKFRGKGIPMALGTGFPDFIAFKLVMIADTGIPSYEVIGVEAKSNGYLSADDKIKIKWLLDNKIFSKILIAYKSKDKRGKIEYKEFAAIIPISHSIIS